MKADREIPKDHLGTQYYEFMQGCPCWKCQAELRLFDIAIANSKPQQPRYAPQTKELK